MVASAVAGEGKTLTASNLALTFSESYQAARAARSTPTCAGRRCTHVFRSANAPRPDRRPARAAARTLPLVEVSPRLAVLPAGAPDSEPDGRPDVGPDAATCSRKRASASTG